MRKGIIFFGVIGLAVIISSCSGTKKDPSLVFMPDMYYPVAYDPYMEADFEYWPVREYDGSEVKLYEQHKNMTALWPADGTVPQTDGEHIMPWELKNTMNDYNKSKEIKTSPLDQANKEANLEMGKKLYHQTCAVCHGDNGDGQGSIVKSGAYSGVPTFGERDITVGSVYHVIMYGRNAMGPYSPQLNQVDRWRVAEYVMSLNGVDTSATADETPNAETEN